MSDDGLSHDELGTERARREVVALFQKCGLPVEADGELFRFAFSELVGRVELVTSARPTNAHVHLTLSSPVFAAPVLDCLVGMGEGPAQALDDALKQWAAGPYWAYHDALAHADRPTFE